MPEIAACVHRASSRPGLLGAVLRYLGARRALVPFLATVGYVVAVGVRVDRGHGGRPWLLGAPAVACALVAAGPRLPGNRLRDDGTRRVGLLAYVLWAFALVLASVDSANRNLWQDLCGGLAALGCGAMAASALAHMQVGQGIAGSLPGSRRSQLAVTLALLVAAFAPAVLVSVRALRRPVASPLDIVSHHAHALTAGAALLILAGSAWETLSTTRLAVGAGDRALTALGILLATSLAAAGLLVLGQGASDRVLRVSLAVAAVAVTFVCTEGDPEVLARRGRRLVALLLYGGPFVLLGGLATEGSGRSVEALLVTGLVALLIGSAVAYLERPLRRAEGRLLDAVDAARSALVRADSETSIRDALAALRSFTGVAGQSPELWSLTPSRVLTIDGAGYPHERPADLPAALLEVARGEPEATVRTELLEALVVRRPDLRPLARWMDERAALSATLVTRQGEVDGVLIVPRGPRRAPMSLEEVRAVKRLADAFSGAATAAGALARSLERERQTSQRATDAETCLRARERDLHVATERDRLVTLRMAEGVAGGPYAPTARVALEAIERRVHAGTPVLVVAPNGADVMSYLARAHLGGPRGRQPFVVVDCAQTVEHDVARWIDPAGSPLALAGRGLLALDACDRLAAEVQRLIGAALAQHQAPWEGADALDLAIALTTSSADGAGCAGLEPALTAQLGDALAEAVRWPRLRERGEDLRFLVLAGLAREGLRVRGAPLGIEDAAYARLADYPYDGEDSELRTILQRLALLAAGDRVRAVDVEKLFTASAGAETRRRRRPPRRDPQ